MKKTYSKPDIMFENFTMSTNIAGDCNIILGTQSEGVCGISGTGGITVFTDGLNSLCTHTPTDMGGDNDDMWDGACYHVPVDTNDLFNS